MKVYLNSVLAEWGLLSSTDNLCKQFRPRSGPGSKQFDTDSVPEDFFEKVNSEKSRQMTIKASKITQQE